MHIALADVRHGAGYRGHVIVTALRGFPPALPRWPPPCIVMPARGFGAAFALLECCFTTVFVFHPAVFSTALPSTASSALAFPGRPSSLRSTDMSVSFANRIASPPRHRPFGVNVFSVGAAFRTASAG
jgi:hypothetical protein